jgi:hypothetical protein
MEKETWTNIGKGDIFILTYDHAGRLRSVPVRAGQSITLSITERQLNQDRAISSDVDFFKNGRLAPLRLIDSADDYEELANNPNHITENDMKDILKLKGKTFTSRLDDISNVIALERMYELASDETLNVSMAQFKALEKRLGDVRGDYVVVSDIEVITK